MGTRADFYVGRGEQAEWLGSIAWDGHPDSIAEPVMRASSEQAFRGAVAAFFEGRDDVTLPAMGWPWPWKNSQTTDYAYAFDGGQTWGCCFGHGWFDARDPEPEDHPEEQTAVFPDMSARKNVQMGSKRSGVIVIGVPRG
jgi:hypothetical protein